MFIKPDTEWKPANNKFIIRYWDQYLPQPTKVNDDDIIEGADPETFESCDQHGYAKDKNNFYLNRKKTKDPDIVKKLKFNGFSLNINNADFITEIDVLKNNEEVYGNIIDTLIQTVKDIFKENPHPHNAKIIFKFKNKSNLKEMSFLPKISINNFFQ